MRGPLLLAFAVAVCLCLLTAGLPLPTSPAQAQAGPSFGSETIDDITLLTFDHSSVTLPEASGGVAPLSYALTGVLPSGMNFNSSTRVLSLWSQATQTNPVSYTYTVTDSSSPPASASLSFTITVNDGPAADKAALEALYDATNGDNWDTSTNWKTNEPIGNWHGVTTDSNGRVDFLRFPDGNNLVGILPPELSNLTRMTQIILDSNPQLAGDIKVFAKLPQLQTIILNDNNLTGEIPKEWGSFPNLQQIRLQKNNLTGQIPKELGNSRIRSLLLDNNSLTGTIPKELGDMERLEQLWLHQNKLTGTIPKELGKLSLLRQVTLTGNQIYGVVPKGWGNLTALDYFWLHGTQLHTPYYPEVAKLQNLDSMRDFGHTDRLGPVFSSGWANQTTVEVTFDEALDEDFAPPASSFTVAMDGFYATTTDIQVSGQTVTLTFSPSINVPETVATVSYNKPAAEQNRLRDLFGHEAESFANEDLDNVTQSAATLLNSLGILSKPSIDADSDDTPDTYGVGDNILWGLYWNEADVFWDVSSPNADIDMRFIVGAETRTASLVRDSGKTSGKGRSLLFRYTVVAEDQDTDGFALHATSVHDIVFLRNGATLLDAQGRLVERSLSGAGNWGNLSGHRVDGSMMGTDTAPEPLIAEADGDTLTLTFNEDIAEPDDPEHLTYKFIVQEATYGDGPVFHQSPNRVTVSGSMVTLTLGSAVTSGWPVTLSYSNDREIKPGGDSGLKDEAGNKVTSFDELSIDNVTAPGTVPVPISATLVEDRLVLTFDRGLDAASSPAGSRFVVTNYDSGQHFRARGVGSPSIRGATVIVELNKEIPAGESAQVIYDGADDDYPLRGQDIHSRLGPSDNQVRDIVGWRAKAPASAAPTPEVVFSSVSGKDVTLYFDRMLEPASAPAETAFSATTTTSGVDTAVSVSAVHVRETAVYLTLATTTSATATVTVRYDQATAEGATLLRDVADNSVATFSRTLTNEGTTKPTTPPTFVSASANGDLLKLTFDRPMDPTKAPASGAFVLSPHVFRGILNATVRGEEVWLRLGRTIRPCEEFTLSYIEPGKEALRDRWGQTVDGFSGREVTNERADECSTTD